MNYLIEFFFLKKSDTFFFWILINFWKVVHDSQWQVHLRRSNIYSKVFYIVLLHFKQLKSLFWANLMIFKNSWLFSESFGYFMHHSYQIWLIWLKIQILWLILDWIDISNQSLGPLGIKGAILVLEPTTVESAGIYWSLLEYTGHGELTCRDELVGLAEESSLLWLTFPFRFIYTWTNLTYLT